jgi:hypothetical protein
MIDDMFPDNGKKARELNEDKGLPLPFNVLKTYLAEISRYPVMTREKEHEISLLVFENKDLDAAPGEAFMMSEKKTYSVGISGSCGGLNLGDEAILHGIITQLRRFLPVEITVFF